MTSQAVPQNPEVTLGSFDLELEAESFVLCHVRQQGIDAVIRLLDGAGHELREVDSPSAGYGLEELAVVLGPGSYRVEIITTADEEADPETLRIEEKVRIEEPVHRPPSDRDRRWSEAASHVLDGRAEIQAKRYEAALPLLEAGLELAEQEDLVYWRAYALEQTATALYRLKRYKDARVRYEEAILWLGRAGEERRQATQRQNLAVRLLDAGLPHKAVELLEAAWPIFERQGNQRGKFLVHLRSASAYTALGRFQNALDHLEQAEPLSNPQKDPRGELSLRLETGRTLLALFRPQEALQAFRVAAETAETLDDQERKKTLFLARWGMTAAALQAGDLDRAERAAERLFATRSDAGNDIDLAALHLTRGHLHRLRGRLDEARADLERARALANGSEDLKARADVLLSLGYVQVQTGHAEEALPLLEEARALYESTEHRSGVASSRARMAEAHHALGRSAEAWRILEPALDEVETLRSEAGSRDHRLSFFASFRQDYFALARDLLLELGDLERAFAVDERRRSRELLDSLRFRGGSGSRERRLEAEEAELERRLRAFAFDDSPEAIAERRALLNEIHQLSTDRATVQPAAPASRGPDVAALQRALPPDTALLVYSLGESGSVLWQVSSSELKAHTLPPTVDVEEAALRFKQGILEAPGGSSLDRLAGDLSRLVLGPAEGLADAERWLIVAEGALLEVPFAALPRPGDGRLVVEKHETVYGPSAAALLELWSQARERSSAPRIAAFVDPVYGAADERAAGTGDPPVLHEIALTRLPRSAEEARYLLSLSPREDHLLLSGFAAHRVAFEETDWSDFDLLHLGTHAFAHDRGELSALVLSLLDENGRARDGTISALDVMRLHMPLDLVVLSACETGRGEEVRGEGVVGLSWAFLDAGADRVVSSLWRVDDQHTAELMKYFYRALQSDGLAPSAALRKAQLEMMRRPGSSLYTWAGFTLQGDWT